MSTPVQNSQTLQPKLRGNTTKFDTKTLVTIAMLAGLAYLVTFALKPFPPVAGFLRFDLKDTIIIIGGFLYGPGAAAMITLVVCLIEFLTISSTGITGLMMNLIATGTFCCTASVLYWYRPNFKGASVGLAVGGILMTGAMLLWNYAITPLYMDIPRSEVVAMLVPIFLPFNLVKAGLNMGVSLAIYPTVMKALSRAKLIVNPEEQGEKKSSSVVQFIVALVILNSFVVSALLLTGVL